MQKPCFDQFAQRSVNRGTAHLTRRDLFPKMVHEVFGVEVVMMAEHLVDNDLPLRGHPFALRTEIFREAQERWFWGFDRAELILFRHA